MRKYIKIIKADSDSWYHRYIGYKMSYIRELETRFLVDNTGIWRSYVSKEDAEIIKE
jgi:hypothetical protein